MTEEDRRIWIRSLLALGVLLPGFPLLMIVIGWPLAMIGLSGPVFMAVLTMHNLYYSLPAAAFGNTHFPAEEFGFLPTPTGTALAAVLYAVIALGLSLPVFWAFRKLKQRRAGDSGEQPPA